MVAHRASKHVLAQMQADQPGQQREGQHFVLGWKFWQLGRSPRKDCKYASTIKLDGNWSSLQLANSEPPLSERYCPFSMVKRAGKTMCRAMPETRSKLSAQRATTVAGKPFPLSCTPAQGKRSCATHAAKQHASSTPAARQER